MLLCLAVGPAFGASRDRPFLESELIFPLEYLHNHGSCIVEGPDGSLLVCWYRGSGERTADDVAVFGARLPRGSHQWSAPFVMADTPGYPDTNPAMIIDPAKRLWLFWPVILANKWETALLKYRVSSDYQKPSPPRWSANEVLHVTPGSNFASQVGAELDYLAASAGAMGPPDPDLRSPEEIRACASDKLCARLGWMTRAHPFVLDGKRFIVPLYSDGLEFSLMAISDDWGRTWFTSAPLVGIGAVQPSLVRRRNGTLVAYLRDNGPAPHRVRISESRDRGETWSRVGKTELPDPGAGVDVVVLKSGRWALINNDLEEGRYSLAVSLSDDEGKTWKWKRHLERDTEAEVTTGAGSYHYPSLIQARDGTLHASYSFHQKQSLTRLDAAGRPAAESIKHAHFNETWIREAH